jgi:hypothetical protein
VAATLIQLNIARALDRPLALLHVCPHMRAAVRCHKSDNCDFSDNARQWNHENMAVPTAACWDF